MIFDNLFLLLLPIVAVYLMLCVTDYRKAFLIVLVIGPLLTSQKLNDDTTAGFMRVLFPPVVLGLILAIITRRQNFRALAIDGKLLLYLFIWLVISLASIVSIRSMGNFISGIINIINMITFMFACSVFIQNEKDLRNALIALVVSSTIATLIALEEYWIEGNSRASGIFWNPNYFGIHVATALLVAPALQRLNYVSPILRLFFRAATIILILGLLMSASQGAILAFLVSLLLLFWLWGSVTNAIKYLVLASALVFIFSTMSDGKMLTMLNHRLNSEWSDTSESVETGSRTLQYKVAMNMALSNPLLGVGTNNYISHFAHYVPWKDLNVGEYYAAYIGVYGSRGSYVTHNDFLAVLAETGFLGFGVFTVLHAVGIRNCLRYLKKIKNEEGYQDIFIIGSAVFVFYVANLIFSITHNYKMYFMYWEPLVMVWLLPRLKPLAMVKDLGKEFVSPTTIHPSVLNRI